MASGRDLLAGEKFHLRGFLRETPGLTSLREGKGGKRKAKNSEVFAYEHDPKGIADALGDPPEIDGWKEWIAE